MKKVFVIIAMLMLVFPAMHAQVDYGQKVWEFLSQGDCVKAEYAYQDYKSEHPKGNAEMEAAIKRCRDGGKNNTKSDAVQTTGTLNGHEWVDLGLPSGTKWATCNVGASSPKEYGSYFAWGETKPKSSYTDDNYMYFSDPDVLPASADAATVNWGKGWRMPTFEELMELIKNCTWIWMSNGYKVTGPNGNGIFLPAAGFRVDSSLYGVGSSGHCWSSSLFTDNPYRACGLFFGSGNYDMSDLNRFGGQSVRPVCVSAQN